MKHKILTIVGTAFAVILVSVLVWKLNMGVKQSVSDNSSKSKFMTQEVPVNDEQNTVESETQIVEGFPMVPVAETLELRESRKRIMPAYTSGDYYAKWVTTKRTVMQLEAWYEEELTKLGWRVEAPNDKTATSEQIIHISKGMLSGYVGIEVEEDTVEVVIDLQQTK